ncbi:hypothetical protein FDZ49_15320 [Salmonella enterica]|nr:hypothetical protein [Salmonella enterica]
MILWLMLNITFSMILCDMHNYHIICPFPVVQIRFPAVPDHPSTRRHTAARKHYICHSFS